MTQIKPALTPEEWAGEPVVFEVKDDGTLLILRLRDEGEPVIRIGHEGTAGALSGPANAKIAALCLHDQAFGFTWEDVDLLCYAAGLVEDHESTGDIRAERCADLADRIGALLAPRFLDRTIAVR